MKQLFVCLLLATGSFAQTKKEKKAQAKQDAVLTTQLQRHIAILASDSLQGRRTGTTGEQLAADYIAKQYQQYQLKPAGTNGTFFQTFAINEGKKIPEAKNNCTINGTAITVAKQYYPLAYSANGSIEGEAMLHVNRAQEPWLVDVAEIMEANQDNPHFDIAKAAYQACKRAAEKQATAVILYNSTTKTDNILFDKNDTTTALPIPVLYINHAAWKQAVGSSGHCKITAAVVFEIPNRTGTNVAAFLDNNATKTVVIGAHYDHLGMGEDKNSLDGEGHIHNGADDNASGTAAIIELARLLQQKPLKNTNFLFLSFSGEELGLLGSKYWLQNPSIGITPHYMLNLDMVGRYDTAKKLTIGGVGTSPSWGKVLNQINSSLIIKTDSSGAGPSDHASFYRKNIPILFFFTNSHSDYHKASDDADKINTEGIVQIVKYIQQVVTITDTLPKLAFTATREQSMGKGVGFTVSLGVIPDYGFTGKGVKIDGVSKGKLAEKIGLQASDILLQLGEYKFVDVSSYMQALSKFKKGDTTELTIKRDDKELRFTIEF